MGKKPVVAPAPVESAPVISAVQADAAFAAGAGEARTSLARIETAENFARALGTNPTFLTWESMRLKWTEGYHSVKPDTSSNAGDKAWASFAKYMGELYGIEKPKSTSAAAEKKAAEREAAKEKLEEKYEGQDLAQIMQQIEAQYTKLAKKPSDKHTEKALKELKQIARIREAEEKEELADEIKELKEGIRKLITSCKNVELLREVHDTLSTEGNDDEI